MAEVAVEYLLSKLEVWIVNETNKQRLAEATQIKNEFERIKPFLRYADWKRLISEDSVVETWVLDVVDLAREVENLIDQDWYDRRHATGLTLSYLWELVGNSFNYSNVNDNNNSSVFSLTLLRKRVCEKLKGVQVKKHLSLFSSSVEAIDERQIRNSKTFTANLSLTHMVGRDTEVTMLKELLLREDIDTLHLIAITGVGGIGKTTLAKTVYECARRYFDCVAWVFVSNRPARFILRDMFMGFSEKWPEMMHGNNFNEMDEKELARRIFDFLDGKKFLLVLDDLDALSAVEDVKCALPQRCRGKVLMTTQSSGFTSIICKHVVHLEPLLPKDALELLQRRACFQHHDLGEAVEPVVQKILQICEGLPIVVATVGAMLSKSILKEPRVLDTILCMLKEAKEGRPQSSLIQVVFMVSYFSLPPTLKCCFLYCGLFPSHYEIPCKRLIRIWVAEGFIATELLGMTQEEIAKNLLDELIQRNLFEVGRLGANGEVISCKLLCLIRKFIIEVLNKDHFCILSDSGGRNICPLEATRILSIHGQIKNVFPSLNSKPIRSMLLFSENEQWTPSVLLNSLCNIRFLHVLELKQIPIGALPDEIGNLVLLHYLSLRGTGICNLPSTLQNLRDLQTLDIRDTYVRALPSGFDGLKMLRHVLLADSFSKRVVKLEGNIMFLKDLQTLAGIKLTEHIATCLPLAELERRCRHNGLSLVGGRETMVARLLYLEEAEKQRGYALDDDLKYAQSQSSSSRYSSGRKETNVEMDSVGLSGWSRYGEDEMHPQGSVSVPLAQTIPTPQSELKGLTNKGKNDPVLPASKWAREDEESDDEQKKSPRDLGLSYSSSGSENAGDGPNRADEVEFAAEASIAALPDSGMNEEQRQKLRRLEVALMEYRESLEERGLKNLEEIEKKVAIHRRRLESEYGLSDSNDNVTANKRSSLERRDRKDSRESLRKRHRSQSGSESPQRKSSSKDREKENDVDRDRERHRDKAHDSESGRKRDREKSGSRERDDHDRGRERDRDRRRRVK